MADKPVLKIPLDTEEWDRFSDSFMQYQKELASQPDHWIATNKEVKAFNKSFDNVQSSFDKLVKASVNPAFSDKGSGSFVRFEKSAKQTRDYWRDTSKSIEKGSKYFENFVRSGIKWESLAKLGGGIAGAGIGLFGAGVAAVDKSAHSIAAQNQQARMLGLKPGESAAFANAYGPAGGDIEQLGKMADAKNNPQKRIGLYAAGITDQEINSKNPKQLAAEMLEMAGSKFKSMGTQGGLWAASTRVTDFLTPEQLRLASSYKHEDYQGFSKQYDEDVPRFAIEQDKADAATKAAQKFDAAWQTLTTAFETAALDAGKDLPKLIDEFADWVSAFSKSDEFKSDVEGFKAAAHDIAAGAEAVAGIFKWMEKISGNLPGDQGQVGNNFIDALRDYASGNFDKALKDLNRPIVATKTDTDAGTDAGTASNSPGFEDKMLDAIRQNESSGNPRALNRDTGAAGLYGLMPANYEKAGIDPYDPVASRALAKKIYDEKLARYGGDPAKALASYDGMGGLDADIKKYGDAWRSHIDEFQTTGETSGYLRKIEKQGIDLRAQQAPTKFDKPADPSLFVAPSADDFSAGTDNQPDGNAKDNTSVIKDSLKAHWDSFTDLFAPGAGAKYFPPDQQQAPKAAPVQQAPVVINVQTNQLPGHNTSITTGSLGAY